MKIEDLKKVLEDRGLPVSGSKAKLLERLGTVEGTTPNGDSPSSPSKRKVDSAAASPSPKKVKKEVQGEGEATKTDTTGKKEPKAPTKMAKGKALSEEAILEGTTPFERCTNDTAFDPKTCYKIISWNVDGLRALLKGENLSKLVKDQQPDVLCLQETKLQKDAAPTIGSLPGYTFFDTCSTEKLGYSGVRVYVRDGLNLGPEGVKYGLKGGKMDTEGRTINLPLPECWIVNTYVPNAGMKLERLEYRTQTWDPAMLEHLLELEKDRPVVWTGDLNVAERDYDRFFTGSYKQMEKSPGFTPEERASFRAMTEPGRIDAFRMLYPNAAKIYSFWSTRFNQRPKNNGWRLDYFVVSDALKDKVVDTFMLPDVMGSDHCPIVLWLKK